MAYTDPMGGSFGSYEETPTGTSSDDAKVNKGSSTKSGTTAGSSTSSGSGASPGAATKGSTISLIPGTRMYNPLSKYASVNYQISLYMLSPDAYNAFVDNSRKTIDVLPSTEYDCGAGAYIICQSGGINNTTSRRAEGFNFDYYIDNLNITATAAQSENGGATTNSYEFNFTITEPYGFSFLSKLKEASDAISKTSKTKHNLEISNPQKQLFVIGIQFLGYDDEGKILPPEIGMEQRYWDVNITDLKFKLDGRTVVYSIKAASCPQQQAFGVQNAQIDKGAAVTGETILDLLKGPQGLFTKMNKDQNDAFQKGKIAVPLEYDVEWGAGAELAIGNATIKSDADLDKAKWPYSKPKDAKGVNPNLAIKGSGSKANKNERIITFNNGTPLIQAIGQLISQSSFLESALKSVYSSEDSPDPKTDSPDKLENNNNKTIKWYNISPIVKDPEWDPKQARYIFKKIIYRIDLYETPCVLTEYAQKTTKYYGPVKRYKYWYTGENTEVTKLELSFNTSYFTVALSSDDPKTATGNGADVSVNTAGKRTDQQRTGKQGVGMESQNNYISSLYDPTAWAKCKFEILGDPDWLFKDASSAPGSYSPFVTSDFTINPTVGQTIVELDFAEGVDYNDETGLMDINRKIRFWNYPPSIEKIVQGISLRVQLVKSSFRAGKFTQELTLNVNTFPEQSEDKAAAQTTSDDESAAERRRLGLDKSPVGLAQDPTPNPAGADPCKPSEAPKTAPSSNDDANKDTGRKSENPVRGGA